MQASCFFTKATQTTQQAKEPKSPVATLVIFICPLVLDDMNLVAVTADTTQALAGGRLYVLDAYMDGAVINPNAIVVAKKA